MDQVNVDFEIEIKVIEVIKRMESLNNQKQTLNQEIINVKNEIQGLREQSERNVVRISNLKLTYDESKGRIKQMQDLYGLDQNNKKIVNENIIRQQKIKQEKEEKKKKKKERKNFFKYFVGQDEVISSEEEKKRRKLLKNDDLKNENIVESEEEIEKENAKQAKNESYIIRTLNNIMDNKSNDVKVIEKLGNNIQQIIINPERNLEMVKKINDKIITVMFKNSNGRIFQKQKI